MSTFKKVVIEYSNHLSNSTILRARYSDESENFAQMVLLSKLDKHQHKSDPRSLAVYLHKWLVEDLGKLPERAKDIARSWRLQTDGKAVGYPHKDGTYHWFQ